MAEEVTVEPGRHPQPTVVASLVPAPQPPLGSKAKLSAEKHPVVPELDKLSAEKQPVVPELDFESVPQKCRLLSMDRPSSPDAADDTHDDDTSYGSDFGPPPRPSALVYSCATVIAGKPFMLSFWGDKGSDEILILGLDTSTAMCGELWLTATEYAILGYPARSRMKAGRIYSEKKHGKMGPFSSTAEKMVCQSIRKMLGLVRQSDDMLYLQIPTITSPTIESRALRGVGLRLPELSNRWLLLFVEEEMVADDDGQGDASDEGPSLKFCGYDPIEGRTYAAEVAPSVWAEKLGVGPLTTLAQEQKLVLCRNLCTTVAVKDGVLAVEPKARTAVMDFRRIGATGPGGAKVRGTVQAGAGTGVEAAAMMSTPEAGAKGGAMRELLMLTRTASALGALEGDEAGEETPNKEERIRVLMQDSPGRQEAEKRHAEMVGQLEAIDRALAEKDLELEKLDAQLQEKQKELAEKDAAIALAKETLQQTQQELGAKLAAQEEELGKQSARAEKAEEEARLTETQLQAARNEVEAKATEIEDKLRRELAELKVVSAAAAEEAEVREAALLAELAERDNQIKGLSYLVGRLERKAKVSPIKERREGGGLTPALDRAEREAAERAADGMAAQGPAQGATMASSPGGTTAAASQAGGLAKPRGVNLDKAGVFTLQ